MGVTMHIPVCMSIFNGIAEPQLLQELPTLQRRAPKDVQLHSAAHRVLNVYQIMHIAC